MLRYDITFENYSSDFISYEQDGSLYAPVKYPLDIVKIISEQDLLKEIGCFVIKKKPVKKKKTVKKKIAKKKKAKR